MKKLFLLSSLLLLSLSVSAQRIDKPNEPYDFYCSVINAVVCVNVIMGEENDKFVLLNDDGRFSCRPGKSGGSPDRFFPGVGTADDLHKLHHQGRIEVVDVQEAFRVSSDPRQLGTHNI